MGRAPDDNIPTSISDYDFTDFTKIEADLDAMEEFAKKLEANVRGDFASHMDLMSQAMMTPVPVPNMAFAELTAFYMAHTQVQNATQDNVYGFGNDTLTLATGAQEVGKKYRGSDAFSHATVADVDKYVGEAPPSTEPTATPSPTTEADL